MRYAFGLLFSSYLLSFHALPWASAHAEALAFLSVIVLGWVAACRHTGTVHLNNSIKAFLVLELLIALQYFSGYISYGGDALMLLVYTHLCITIVLAHQKSAGAGTWAKAMALTLLGAALASTLIALSQALWVWESSDWIFPHAGFRRPGANLGQPNHLGTLLVMGLASLIYLDQRLHISRITVLILSFVLILGIGVVESRTSVLSAVGLFLWWVSGSNVFSNAPRWPWMLGAAFTLILLVVIWPPFIGHIHEPGVGPSHAQGASINLTAGMRSVMWPQLWQAVLQRPWLGWGLGNVSSAHNSVLDSYAFAEPFTYAHSIVLDIAIGLGLPMTGLAVWAVSVWIWRCIKSGRSLQTWYAIAILIPFAIHSLLEYPFAYAYFLIPATLAVAMLEQNNTEHIAGVVVPRKVLVGSLIAFSGIMAWIAVEYLEIEEDFRVARFEALRVGQTPLDYERPKTLALTQLTALVTATRLEVQTNMTPEEVALLRSVAIRFPLIATRNQYALSLALNGNPHEANRELKAMRALYRDDQYVKYRDNWIELANTKYPQLKAIEIP